MAKAKNSYAPASRTKNINKHNNINKLLKGFDYNKISASELILNDEESCHSNDSKCADDTPIINKERDTVLIKDTVVIKNKLLKREIQITKDRLINNNGYLKHKSRDNLEICNNILMSELMIDNSKEKHIEPTNSNNLNNNDNVTNNKNKRKSSKDNEKTDVKKRKKDSEKSNINSKRKKSTDDSNSEQNKVRKKKLIVNLDSRNLVQPRREKKRIIKKGLYICDICCRQFDTRPSILRHMYLHLFHKQYPCRQCNRVFYRKLYLQAHIKRLHPDWDQHYMCNLCCKPFLTKENLAIHMTNHNNTETMFKCLYCKEKFVQQYQVIEHEKKHLVNGEYKCTSCNRLFQNRNKLSLHLNTHLKVKEYICQHCGKEFLRNNSLRRHVQISHERLRIQCKICKKVLKGHLKEHMRIHENYRPHKCQDCGMCFAQSTHLTVHIRSHTGARPYACRICKRPFSHSNGLLLHIRVHTGEKPFQCPLCPLTFTQLPHMKSHMYKIHGKEKPYRCNECKKYFKLKKDIENHTKICNVGSEEESVVVVDETAAKLSRLRFLLALLLTMIASKSKLKYLGFNKRLIDDLLVESLEAMGQTPCKDVSLSPLKCLEKNVDKLLKGTVPKEKLKKFRKQGKTTEEILELLTDEKK